MKFLNNEELSWSAVVANCNMNRKRGLLGVNSYQKEVGFNILEFLMEKRQKSDEVIRWLDLCCGEGKALIEANNLLIQKGLTNIEFEGIDLVDMFHEYLPSSSLKFQVTALHDWNPNKKYDLITCIHGLHYIGDKLDVIAKSIHTLKEDGLFKVNIDVDSIRLSSSESLKKYLVKKFTESGINYNSKKRLLTCEGSQLLTLKVNYLGANDKVGKNYTGQEAVDSYYEIGG